MIRALILISLLMIFAGSASAYVNPGYFPNQGQISSASLTGGTLKIGFTDTVYRPKVGDAESEVYTKYYLDGPTVDIIIKGADGSETTLNEYAYQTSYIVTIKCVNPDFYDLSRYNKEVLAQYKTVAPYDNGYMMSNSISSNIGPVITRDIIISRRFYQIEVFGKAIVNNKVKIQQLAPYQAHAASKVQATSIQLANFVKANIGSGSIGCQGQQQTTTLVKASTTTSTTLVQTKTTTSKATTTTIKRPTTTTIFPPYDQNKNYCGPEGKFGVPNTNPTTDASFNRACYNHDRCYTYCNDPRNTQENCDNAFKTDMDEQCSQKLDELLRECDPLSAWNPFRYTCIAKVRLEVAACWGQSKTYQTTVSLAGKMIGAYPC